MKHFLNNIKAKAGATFTRSFVILAICLARLLSVGALQAQTVSAQTFPIGSLQVSYFPWTQTPLDSIIALGGNIFSAGYGYSVQATVSSSSPIMGLNGGNLFAKYGDYSERRNYLWSGYRTSADRSYDHATDRLGFVDQTVHTPSGSMLDMVQRYVSATATDTLMSKPYDSISNSYYSGHYVLRQLDHTYRPLHDAGDLTRLAHYFDFVYAFKDTAVTAWTSLNIDSPIYTVEILVRGNKDTSHYGYDAPHSYYFWKEYDTVLRFPITKRKFWSAMDSAHGTDQGWWTTDINHTLRSPFKQEGNPTYSYARSHMVLDSALMYKMNFWGLDTSKHLSCLYRGLDDFWDDNGPGVRYDVRVRRDANIVMYVKGVRTREAGAERLLTGQLDVELDSAFARLKRSQFMFDKLETGDYYPSTLMIHGESEPPPGRFAILGYLDRYALYHGDKRFISFTPPWHTPSGRLVWDEALWSPKKQNALPKAFYTDYDWIVGSRNGGFLPGEPVDAMPKDERWNSRLFSDSVIAANELKLWENRIDSADTRIMRHYLQTTNTTCFQLGAGRIPFWIQGQAFIGIFDGHVGHYINDNLVLTLRVSDSSNVTPDSFSITHRKNLLYSRSKPYDI